MKFKKVIINGKEYYELEDSSVNLDDVEINIDGDISNLEEVVNKYIAKAEQKVEKFIEKMTEESDVVKAAIDKAITAFKDGLRNVEDEDEIEDLYDEFLDDLEEAENDYEEFLDDLEEAKEEAEETVEQNEPKGSKYFGQDFGKRFSENFSKAFNGIFGSANMRKKNNKIVSLLPFMDQESIHEIVLDIINGNEELKELDLVTLMPFVSHEDANLIFEHALNNNKQMDFVSLAPFVNKEKLSLVVDKYIAGEINDISIDNLYPFLSKEDINKLFKHYMKK